MGRPTGEAAPPEHRPRASASSGPGETARDVLAVALVFGLALAIFVASPNHWLNDAPFSLLAPEALARRGDLGLAGHPNALATGLVAAAYGALAFLTSRLVLARAWSAIVAAIATLGTPVYSAASRFLGADTWALLLAAAAGFLLLRSATHRRTPGGVALAVLVSVAAFVQPTAVVGLLGVGVYLGVVSRRALIRFAITTAVMCGGLVALSTTRLGQSWLGGSWPGPLRAPQRAAESIFTSYLASLLAHLASPGRGVLLFAPALAAAVALAVAWRRRIRFPALAGLAGAVVVGHALAIAGVGASTGTSFGAAAWTPVVPWFALLAILGLDAAAIGGAGSDSTRSDGAGATPGRSQVWLAAGLVCAASVAINTVGAVSFDALAWNVSPVDVATHPARIWDWRQPQLLAPLLAPPGDYLPIPVDGIRAGTDAAAPFLGAGWSHPEGDFRWTEGRVATVKFAGESGLPDAIRIEAGPYAPPGPRRGQRVKVLLNGHAVATTDIAVAGFAAHVIQVPARYLRARNILCFILPDAVSPLARGESSDDRQLGLAVRSIAWAHGRPLPEDGIRLGSADAEAYLRAGWSYAEADFRWTDGPTAAIAFAGEVPAPDAIEIDLRPHVTPLPHEIARQRVSASLNGTPVWTAELTSPRFASHLIPIPPGALKEQNTLTFTLPDAAPATDARNANDSRQLAVAMRSIRWIRSRSLAGEGIRFAMTEAVPYLGTGWSVPEGDFRWSDQPMATMNLGGRRAVPEAINIELRPYLVPGKVERQHLEVRLNGHQVSSQDLTSLTSVASSAFVRTVVSLPAAFMLDKDNVLAFVLPDAVAPSALGPSDDHRRLGIAVRGMREAISIPDIHLGRADADRFLRGGWSDPEADFRWTNGATADVAFESETRRASALELELSPYLVAGKVDQQHVELVLNGRSIWSAELRAPGFAPYVIALPPDALEARNVLELRLADAISPSQVERSTDVRRLGVAVRVIRSGRRGADTAQDAGAPRPW